MTPASDFTLTITGVTASGGNSFAGSETGVTKIITTFGSYNLTESAVVGYVQTGASGCSGTITAGEQRPARSRTTTCPRRSR